MNVALLAGLALLPCVILVGLLRDDGDLAKDIGPAALRGTLDAAAPLPSPLPHHPI